MASQLTSLHRKSPELQTRCNLSSTRISLRFSRSIAMVPPPPVQPLSYSEITGSRIGNVRFRRYVAVESHRKLNLPLVAPDDQWGNLAVLFSAGALGIWSEKTKMGSALNGPLVSTLLGFAASNVGIIASDALAFPIVMEFLLPLAYTMLLFRADLRRVMKPTVTLLPAFLISSGLSSVVVFFLWIVGTTIGSVAAILLVPVPSFGQLFWNIAALLMGMHIGGAIRYLNVSDTSDISDAFDVDSAIFSSGLVANNVIRAVYFTLLFALASKVPPETTTVNDDVGKDTQTKYDNKFPVLQSATSLAMSFAICKVGSYLTKYFKIQGGTMPAITTIVVILATIFPKLFGYLAPSGEAMATILMQVFFVAVGAKENIFVVNTAPHIFMFSLVQILFHFVIAIGLGKLLRFDLKSLLVASIGNVGGPMTVYGMTAAKGWNSIVIPGILAEILRIPIAGFISIGLLSIRSAPSKL